MHYTFRGFATPAHASESFLQMHATTGLCKDQPIPLATAYLALAENYSLEANSKSAEDV